MCWKLIEFVGISSKMLKWVKNLVNTRFGMPHNATESWDILRYLEAFEDVAILTARKCQAVPTCTNGDLRSGNIRQKPESEHMHTESQHLTKPQPTHKKHKTTKHHKTYGNQASEASEGSALSAPVGSTTGKTTTVRPKVAHPAHQCSGINYRSPNPVPRLVVKAKCRNPGTGKTQSGRNSRPSPKKKNGAMRPELQTSLLYLYN